LRPGNTPEEIGRPISITFQIVVRKFSEEERIGIIEMLWEVAYSDGILTGDEDALIRRVAGLIYVSDWERGEAKRRITQTP
jgi:uncharacterized tellurite resistance protein B-like protein